MRALLIQPGSRYSPIDVATFAELYDVIGATAIDVRPFTLTPPLLSIAMDQDFVQKWLDPSLFHPTYRERYVLCGPLVVFRATEANEIIDLTEHDLTRAIAIIAKHTV